MTETEPATPPEPAEVVAVFGGSFNPPHIGHVLMAVIVLSTCAVDRVLVIPTYSHPFAKQLAPFDDRVRMMELAMAGVARVEISRIEEALGGESRTLRTLEHLHAEHPSWKLRLVMGADLLAESPKWYAFDKIAALAPPIVLGRVGFDIPGAPPPVLPAISSTEIRAIVARGAWAELEPLVPRAVVEHIRAHALYTS
ncbi:nicotinate (nicotinamide) nucleotide adenylyltransferase [Pendulispora albinea]|uniref:Probable nicotinate-nucleotide adenylyltransferase n=1 Tax=Pendulispora albinea TaxID=2741071 RepID=A0ABZ2M3I4_9BACT